MRPVGRQRQQAAVHVRQQELALLAQFRLHVAGAHRRRRARRQRDRIDGRDALAAEEQFQVAEPVEVVEAGLRFPVVAPCIRRRADRG